MKKLASLVMTTLMVSQLLIPCFAANKKVEITDVGSTSIVVSTTTTAKYTISYPAYVKISKPAKISVIGEVKANKMLISPHKAVKVEISSLNDFNLVYGKENGKNKAYKLLTDGSENLTCVFEPGEKGKRFPLSVKISPGLWSKGEDVDYSDLLTFTVSYVNN